MTPVSQTLFGAPCEPPGMRGNCLSAAFASLLNLTLEQVPHFVASPRDDWWVEVQEWLRSIGYMAVEVSVRDYVPDGSMDGILNVFPYGRFYAIGSGPSPRGEFLHSVVVRVSTAGIENVHDPHPSGAFLTRLTHLKFLVPISVEA